MPQVDGRIARERAARMTAASSSASMASSTRRTRRGSSTRSGTSMLLITPTSAVSLQDGMALVSLHCLVAAVVIIGLRRASAVARSFAAGH